jgi:hypothetical protein
MMNWCDLTIVYISDCNSLTCIPDAAAGWKALKHLTLYRCAKLEFISEEAAAAWTNLEYLIVGYCESLMSFPVASADAWTRLRVLKLDNCHNLSEIVSRGQQMNWSYLTQVHISNCHKLSYIPEALKHLTRDDENEFSFERATISARPYTTRPYTARMRNTPNSERNNPSSAPAKYKTR